MYLTLKIVDTMLKKGLHNYFGIVSKYLSKNDVQ